MKKHLSYLLILFLFFISCDSGGSSDSEPEGKAGDIIKLDIPEPSGLTISPDGKNLWIVSDSKKKIYKTNTRGTILSKISVEIKDNNGDALEGMEGIAFDASTSTLWICLEEACIIANCDLNGNVLFQKSMEYIFENQVIDTDETDNLFDYKKENGMEGIAVDADYIYLIIEKGHFIKLNKSDLSIVIEDCMKLTFSGEDYSGAYLDNNGNLWVASHEAMAVYKWDMTAGDTAEEIYSSADFNIQQLEGFAIDPNKKLAYFCSDEDAYLYILDVK